MDSCLSDDRAAPLSFESPSFQSCLKQLSWSSRTHHGMHKRFRPPVGSGLNPYAESKEHVVPLIRAHSGLDGSLPSNYFFDEVGEDCLSARGHEKSNGLVRSQSYPLEGFYSALETCIVNITKTSSIIESNFCTKNQKNTTLSKDSCSKPQHAQQDAIASPPGAKIQQRRQEEHARESSPNSDNSVPVAPTIVDTTADVAAKGPPPGKDLVGSPFNSTLPTRSDSTTKTPQIEDTLSSRASMSSQARHCSAAKPGPLGSKVLACGRRREMEDTASVIPSFTTLPCGFMGMCSCNSDHVKHTSSDLHFFGVYDGHGGSQASNYCKGRFHVLVAEELSVLDRSRSGREHSHHGWIARWKETLKVCFSKIDMEVGGVCPNGICDDESSEGGCVCCEDAIAPETVGTTAVVAIVGSRQIVIGNCGDSRAVLSRGGQAIALSTDHKPEREDETSRIEAAGGKVICWDGYRVGGFLALSRAIGDRYLKRYVISDPEVTCIPREEEDELLLLGSDGLWDVLSNDYACEVARKALLATRKKRDNRVFAPGEDPAAAAVAALLVKLAYSKGSKDNISVVVVDLKS